MLNSDHIFVHLITICIGLIIAFGLQQIVDLYMRRRARQQQLAKPVSKFPDDDHPTPPI
jgi:hypothetical protein